MTHTTTPQFRMAIFRRPSVIVHLAHHTCPMGIFRMEDSIPLVLITASTMLIHCQNRNKQRDR